MSIHPETVDQYIESGCGRCELGGTPRCKVRPWVEVLTALREILNASELREEIKWSAPTYTHEGQNLLMLSALKDSVVISFFRGAEMEDPEGLLEKPGEHSRFARYLRFTDAETAAVRKAVILDFVSQAIALERAGPRPDAGGDDLPDHPEELIEVFDARPDFREAFLALTPGRQRGYLIHFNSAKQSKTKTARIERCMPKIFIGKGWGEY